MISLNKKIIISIFLMAMFGFGVVAHAQIINIDASKLLAHVGLSFSPRSGSFEEGSTFQVPVLINTKNRSINGIEVHVNYDKNKLSIISPIGGTSIIGIWTEPPRYDNSKGTASYVGVVPNGVTTGSGLISTITFKALAPGNASISFADDSRILLNDGLGTEAVVDATRAEYSILPKAPGGVQIYSETHPVQSDWYNNNTPSVSWIKDPGVTGFSFDFDNKPNTVPDNTIDTGETNKNFDKLSDGLWYFHIKAFKAGAWSTAGHFLIRIDTAPPAEFSPETNLLTASVLETSRTLVSFFTTDNLSGVDHYEIGIIDKNQPATESPVFVQAESPFQVPTYAGSKLEVIVRAIDKAGNVRDESVGVRQFSSIFRFFRDYPVYVLLAIIFLGLILFIMHFFVGHHVLRTFRRVMQVIRKEKY